MKNASIAQRLTFLYGFALAGILAAAALFLYLSLRSGLELETRGLLEDRTQAILTILQRDASVPLLRRRVESDWSHRLEKIYVRVDDSSGHSVTESPQAPPDLRSAAFERHILDDGKGGYMHLSSAAGTPLLTLARRITGPDAFQGWSVYVSADLAAQEALLTGYRWRIAGAILGSFLLSLLLGRWIVAKSLEPVAELARAMSEIRSSNLSRRVSVKLPSELRILGSSFNELLDRIETSVSKLSQFSADIAHELRNPIHNIRGEMEVALGRCRSREEYEEVLSSCLEECDRLKSIVDSLLFLARMETSHDSPATEPLALEAELANIIEFYEAAASEANVTLALEVPPELRVLAHRPLLQSAIGNLLSNAIRYTPAGARVTLLARARMEGGTVIEVRDEGAGIPSADLPRVFDRLYRADRQRSFSGEGHFGLGLSIVQAILRLHGGKAEIESEEGKGTLVRLTFPRSEVNAAVIES
jgi:two-component system heavy metal sensor histidine kinase CusS